MCPINSAPQSIGTVGGSVMATATTESAMGAASPVAVRLLLVNSVIAFAIALPVMVTLHELAHGVAGVAEGLQPTVYPGQVVNRVPGTTGQQVIQLFAGPLASLVMGLLALL